MDIFTSILENIADQPIEHITPWYEVSAELESAESTYVFDFEAKTQQHDFDFEFDVLNGKVLENSLSEKN